ncbi:MAG: diguanylate cyclase [Zoogloeaceae bacterium]|jgi:diguanylate cyclase (GGDEF)-like protein|nr:diguanylate cyclase [Zoogloeaceae bacterium]
MAPLSSLQLQEQTLRQVWARYRARPDFEHFVVFSSLLNSFTDALTDKTQAGLLHVCRQLEQQALALFGDEKSHPVSAQKMEALDKRVTRLSELMRYYAGEGKVLQERRRVAQEKDGASGAPNAARICLMGEQGPHWHDLMAQLGYFGISARQGGWDLPETDDSDLSIYLVDMGGVISPERLGFLKRLRERRSMARIVCMDVPDDFMFINRALQAGVTHCMTPRAACQQVLGQVLGAQGVIAQESYRVLVVEDSLTAVRAICNSLTQHGVTTHELRDPSLALQAIRQFQPDLILMDMYMPSCTGVEAARVIRQYPEFLSVPIVYLSGETSIGLQVEALRLGGDQFLTKPFNPVLMNAVVKSKIDRYRDLRRSMQNDSLTGLLNHISTKQALAAALEILPEGSFLDVVMLDIDHFKNVNDTHGHPVGDQVIRSLAWLLKQRLRHNDIVGRYGGEEFVVGLVSSRPGSAVEILDRIREDFSRILFNGANDVQFKVSFSAGVAVSAGGEQVKRLEILLEAADEALYEAKHHGRNQVVLSGQKARVVLAEPEIREPLLAEPTIL